MSVHNLFIHAFVLLLYYFIGYRDEAISRLLSLAIYYGDCYAVGVILSLIYVALRVLKWRGKGFICLLSKTVFYCVTEKQRTDH